MWRYPLSLCLLTLAAMAQPAIPDTPAGRTFKAWLDAFNSADRARVTAYIQKYEPGKTEHLDMMMQLRDMSGGLDIVSIDKSEPLHIEFHLKERARDVGSSGQLDVKDGEPAIVAQFQLRASGPGSTEMSGKPGPATPIDAATRQRVIDGAVAKLEEFYVFPETAKKMEDDLRERHKRGEYDKITGGDEFARMLTDHLQQISHDKHLRVNFSPTTLPDGEPGASPEAKARFRKEMERINCGFEKVERLTGNIGYVKFNMFADPQVCGPTAVSAMNFLGNVDAIIFDLRSNGGGEPAMIALISSYLFDEPTHLNDLWERKGR